MADPRESSSGRKNIKGEKCTLAERRGESKERIKETSKSINSGKTRKDKKMVSKD